MNTKRQMIISTPGIGWRFGVVGGQREVNHVASQGNAIEATGSTLSLLSAMMGDTLIGPTIDEVKDIYMLAHGSQTERSASLHHLARDVEIVTVGTVVGGAVGLLASRGLFAASWSGFGGRGLAGQVGSVGTISTGAESSVGLTTRLNRSEVKRYLTNVKDIPREQLVNDLQSLGLEFKGGSRDGRFMEFIDKYSNLRIKIHPPDNVGTNYHHLHLYDKQGNPLTAQLEKAPYKSSDVHIEIGSDFGYRLSLTDRRNSYGNK